MAQVDQDWLIEFIKGTGKLFLNPVFYYLFFLAAVLGVSRVKRERRNFHIRAENAYYELKQLIPLGLLIGLITSLVTISIGLAIPMIAVIFIVLSTFILSLSSKIRLLSPVYTVGFAFFATIFAFNEKWKIPYVPKEFMNKEQAIFPSIAVLLGLLIICEGVLIIRNGRKGTSPMLVKSKRGQVVGIHEIKRVWMLPVFLFIPGGSIQALFEWWPVLTVGSQTFSLLLFPFTVGFHQQVQGHLPIKAVSSFGKKVIYLGIIIALLSVSGYWYPIASIVVVALAIIGRELLTLKQNLTDENLPFYFSKKNHGLMILGIIPDSPAFKMSLQVGELITKVNGTAIKDEKGFYHALQRNRAHCKLEVLNVHGEVRFVQRALFEGDHHELGILFVQDGKKREAIASSI